MTSSGMHGAGRPLKQARNTREIDTAFSSAGRGNPSEVNYSC